MTCLDMGMFCLPLLLDETIDAVPLVGKITERFSTWMKPVQINTFPCKTKNFSIRIPVFNARIKRDKADCFSLIDKVSEFHPVLIRFQAVPYRLFWY